MNNILSFFQESSERVEHFLDNRLINSSVFTAKLNEGMRYSLFAGGKRLRPALVYASYGLFSGSDNNVIFKSWSLINLWCFCILSGLTPKI